jgi:hypothetical protein
MADTGAVSTWFDRLVAVNGETFAAGHYEAAYHALMAALHVAEDAGDEPRLLEVARIAEEQRRHIDSLAPAHPLSSQVAKARGHEGVYALAVRQATVRARIVHHSRHKDKPYSAP